MCSSFIYCFFLLPTANERDERDWDTFFCLLTSLLRQRVISRNNEKNLFSYLRSLSIHCLGGIPILKHIMLMLESYIVSQSKNYACVYAAYRRCTYVAYTLCIYTHIWRESLTTEKLGLCLWWCILPVTELFGWRAARCLISHIPNISKNAKKPPTIVLKVNDKQGPHLNLHRNRAMQVKK